MTRLVGNSSSFALEVWLTELTARHLWRALRLTAGRQLSRRCRRCILSTRHSPLDASGLCPACAAEPAPGNRTEITPPAATITPPGATGARELDAILAEHQGRGRGRHDALLLFSGGKDSTYLLHRISRDYPRLRLATLLVDNGFMSPYALQNAARVRARFGDVEHLTVRPKATFVTAVMRYALTHLEQQRGYSIVDLMDGHITFDTAKNLAARLDIPLVLCGLSRVQAEYGMGIEHFELDPRQLRNRPTEYAGLPLDELCSAEDRSCFWDGSLWPAERVPRFLLPLWVWEPSEALILSEVERLGLLDARRSSPLMTNNALIPVIAMAELARFGYCCWEVEFARMIREGRAERPYWLNLFEMLEYAAKSGRFISKTVDQTLARLELTREQVGIPRPS